MDKRLIVVGNDFGKFADNANVITMGEYKSRANSDSFDGADVIPGLGLAADEFQSLVENNNNQLQHRLAASNTHKTMAENVMITEPRRLKPLSYEMEFILSDAKDRLLDHVNGMHVSGMVLIEAARQASISCTELEFKLSETQSKTSFMWTGMDANFSKFAFPVPTTVIVNMHELVTESSSRKSLESQVIFIQGGLEMSSMQMRFDLLPDRLTQQLEKRSASSLKRGIFQENEPMDQAKVT